VKKNGRREKKIAKRKILAEDYAENKKKINRRKQKIKNTAVRRFPPSQRPSL
jgi:hypothetical protein